MRSMHVHVGYHIWLCLPHVLCGLEKDNEVFLGIQLAGLIINDGGLFSGGNNATIVNPYKRKQTLSEDSE